MNITEVRIKWPSGNKVDAEAKLIAYCSVTFDGELVVHDLKIVNGVKGPFVAMPSRKLCDHCNSCSRKNHLRAKFCNHCGAELGEAEVELDDKGRSKLYQDVVHPCSNIMRDSIEQAVMEAYRRETCKPEQVNGGTVDTVAQM